MSTLTFRLAGPMQSYGTSSKFSVRGTGTEPSKSAVVGILAAALGRSRDESVADLAGLFFAVRVDRPGTIERDFQTTSRTGTRNISHRYYLADAAFTVTVGGDSDLIRSAAQALRNPVFPISLGRKSYLPYGPIVPTVTEHATGLETLLDDEADPDALIVRDTFADEVHTEEVCDLPVSFSRDRRRYSYRPIVTETVAEAVSRACS